MTAIPRIYQGQALRDYMAARGYVVEFIQVVEHKTPYRLWIGYSTRKHIAITEESIDRPDWAKGLPEIVGIQSGDLYQYQELRRVNPAYEWRRGMSSTTRRSIEFHEEPTDEDKGWSSVDAYSCADCGRGVGWGLVEREDHGNGRGEFTPYFKVKGGTSRWCEDCGPSEREG